MEQMRRHIKKCFILLSMYSIQKNLRLKIEPNFRYDEPWEQVCYSDSDYASDTDSRQSLSRFVLYACQVPISWGSKGQKSVMLLSSDTEWVALSEAIKEVMFVSQLLTSMKIWVQYPIIVHVDNVRAIFMAQNITTSSCTKHVDVRYKYVNEFVEDGVVKIVFVKSKENNADLFTKNLSGELHFMHSSKLVLAEYLKEVC